ncbi:ABC transporter permease [Pseudonocardia bannensis]|uniref:ABC transporter permease n=1 Tax=Pseudonocardia bannensis TaxID=630973 RepID=A0A848DH91_9PSEU|nr:ABC transporter permease [Pseudonocardia bannensis]NMH91903.1 ABC transporter permease [Pseudonocardia bannensis]
MSDAGRVLALAGTELRLVLRNKTVAVSSIVVPLAVGVFWAFSFGASTQPGMTAMAVALQLSIVLAMGIYVTATQTVVGRRHNRVLKRLRTSGISDTGLLVATVAPAVVIGLVQLGIFGIIHAVIGSPWPVDPFPLVLALLGGLALVVTAALATTVVTPSPERSQITTLPLTFLLLAAAAALAVVPSQGWWQALVAVPGAPIGRLTQLAYEGGTWAAGPVGLPALLPAVAALLVWPVVFGYLAARRFRWDPRH